MAERGPWSLRAALRTALWAALSAALLAGLSAHAHAQEAAGAASTSPAADGWIVTLGGTAAYAPSYEGARTYGPSLLPSFDLRRADEPASFGAPDDNFGLGLFDFSGFRFGALAGIRDGRPEWVIPGLPGYATAVEVGAFAEYWAIEDHLRTRVEVLQGVAADGGLSANLSADLVQKAGPLTFSVGPRLSLADSTYMQTAFGVSPLAASINGRLSPYDADAGLKSLGLTTSLSYDLSQDWTATIYGTFQRLTGAAAASPIIPLAGSPNQTTIGVGLEHSFLWGH